MIAKEIFLTKYREYLRHTKPLYFERMPNEKPGCLSKKSTTNGLTQCIIHFLKWKGWEANRISSAGRMLDNTRVVIDVIGRSKIIGSKKYIPSTTRKGTSDISATINGRAVKIEVKNKRTKDNQSPRQVNYQKMTDLSGGVYLIAESFEQIIPVLFEFPDNPRKVEFWGVGLPNKNHKDSNT